MSPEVVGKKMDERKRGTWKERERKEDEESRSHDDRYV